MYNLFKVWLFISDLAPVEAELLEEAAALLGQVLHHHALDANLGMVGEIYGLFFQIDMV